MRNISKYIGKSCSTDALISLTIISTWWKRFVTEYFNTCFIQARVFFFLSYEENELYWKKNKLNISRNTKVSLVPDSQCYAYCYCYNYYCLIQLLLLWLFQTVFMSAVVYECVSVRVYRVCASLISHWRNIKMSF